MKYLSIIILASVLFSCKTSRVITSPLVNQSGNYVKFQNGKTYRIQDTVGYRINVIQVKNGRPTRF